MRQGNPAFNSFAKGVAIGVDTMVNDKVVVGMTLSNSLTNVKYKPNTASTPPNKSTASSWVGAIFGNYQFTNNWFVRGAALFNRTHINDKNRKLLRPHLYGLAQAKYNLISYGGEASVGFIHTFANKAFLVPTIGARVLHSNKMTYSETGNTGQNTTNMIQKAMNNYSALAGISVSKTLERSDLNFVPEAHANFQYGLNVKSPKGSFVSPLSPTEATTFVGTKAAKLTSAYGGSLTMGGDRVECSLSGDVSLADKYVGYQGSMKLKVRF